MRSKLLAFVCSVALSGSAHAMQFDTRRDMGPCTSAPHFGKNCVTVNFSDVNATIGESKKSLDEHLASFKQLANEQKLGNIGLQYSSFTLNVKPTYHNETSYELIARATYEMQTPEHANAFVKTLKDHKFQADILSGLMDASQCPMSKH